MTRADLQTYLEGFGMKVYYQPPNNDEIVLPCLVYDLAGMDTYYSDNSRYLRRKEFEVKHMYTSKRYESVTEDIIDGIEYASYANSYTQGNVITDVIKIYI